jgi:hypothetical protein
MISDDGINCSASVGSNDYNFNDNDDVDDGETEAAEFDDALLALSPEHFGTKAERNYNWYSIVGMAENDPATKPWGPGAAITDVECTTGDTDGPGTGYQALSVLTKALRYPICENDNFDAIFNAIADGVIEQAKVSCEWTIPEPPAGEVFDPNKVNVQYTLTGGDPVNVLQVAKKGDCDGEDGWYYDDNADPTQVLACPATCDTIEADNGAKVDVLFGCETLIKIPK